MTHYSESPSQAGPAGVSALRDRYRSCFDRFEQDLERDSANDLLRYLEYGPVEEADLQAVFSELLSRHLERRSIENHIAAEADYIKTYSTYRTVIKQTFARRIRISDKIKITQFLNSGGMGDIYKAQSMIGRPCVIKILREDQLDKFCNSVLLREAGLAGKRDFRREALARFSREVKITAELRNPGTIYAHDAGVAMEDGKSLYLEMEFVDGLSLDVFQRAFLKRCGSRLSVGAVCELIAQVAETMQNFHHSIVHRDIKPSNIMAVLRDGDGKRFTKVLDFGLAKHHSASKNSANDADQITTGFEYLGTPDYSSPEQFTLARAVEPVSDIYSLGCTLFELLDDSMAPPFAALRNTTRDTKSMVSQLKNAHMNGLPAIRRAGLPQGVRAAVSGMTAIDFSKRFEAGEVIEALRKHRQLEELQESVNAFNEHRECRKPRRFF